MNVIFFLKNLQKDIGWAEGVFSSGIMFRVECWALDGITMLTYYIPGQEHERHSSDYFFKELLIKEGLIEFISDKQYIEVVKLRNKFELPLVWCVNDTVGDEDETFGKDNTVTGICKESVQPLISEAIILYTPEFWVLIIKPFPDVPGIAETPNIGFQAYVVFNPPFRLIYISSPAHPIGFGGEAVIDKEGTTVISIVSVFEQPFISVPVTI